MIKKWKTMGLLSLVIILSACSSNAYLSQKATNDFRTDGLRSEWTGRFQIPEGESFALGVSHDKNYVYVAISSIDKGFQRRIALGGLTLWLDVKGGKRQNLGIKFEGTASERKRPGAYQREQYKVDGRQSRGMNSAPLPIIDGDLTLILIDTKAGKSLGPADLMASANSDNETLFVEYQIPLAILGADFDIQKKLGLRIVSTSTKPNMREGHSGGMKGGLEGGGQGGRSGGRGGGQRGGGRQAGGPSGTDMGQNDLDVWMKIKLTS